MSCLHFTQSALAAALARGVRQCVVIGSQWPSGEAGASDPDHVLQVFSVNEKQPSDCPATFVPTQFASEALAAALAKSGFDQRKSSLFVWFGGAGYRTMDAVLDNLAFVASLPRGSGVVFDYVVERTFPGPLIHTALDALASRIEMVSGSIKHLIDPSAVAAMLRGLGFQKVVDRALEEQSISGRHLVSAVI